MNLAVFDIDGTLTDTNQVDTECFAEAVQRVLGKPITTDWSSYPNVTDSGILRAVGCSEPEIVRVRLHFFALLHERTFDEIRGARKLLARIAREPDWRIAYATGGWEASARMKLASAGLPLDLPLGSSDDADTREEIVRRAIDRATEEYGCRFKRIVLIGDGAWDRKTAEKLRLPFIGTIDWSDPERVLRALRTVERVNQ